MKDGTRRIIELENQTDLNRNRAVNLLDKHASPGEDSRVNEN